MGSLSNYAELELLDHVFGMGNRDYTPPSNIWIALSTADPTEDGSGLAEPGDTYARKQTVYTDWTVAASGALENVGSLEFPEATASWGTIAYFALMDAVSGGNMLAYGSITPTKAIGSGDTARFAAGDLDVSMD